MSGIELLQKVRVLSPDTIRILMTAYADLSTALEAINTGEIYKFIVKPWKNDALKQILSDAIERVKA